MTTKVEAQTFEEMLMNQWSSLEIMGREMTSTFAKKIDEEIVEKKKKLALEWQTQRDREIRFEKYQEEEEENLAKWNEDLRKKEMDLQQLESKLKQKQLNFEKQDRIIAGLQAKLKDVKEKLGETEALSKQNLKLKNWEELLKTKEDNLSVKEKQVAKRMESVELREKRCEDREKIIKEQKIENDEREGELNLKEEEYRQRLEDVTIREAEIFQEKMKLEKMEKEIGAKAAPAETEWRPFINYLESLSRDQVELDFEANAKLRNNALIVAKFMGRHLELLVRTKPLIGIEVAHKDPASLDKVTLICTEKGADVWEALRNVTKVLKDMLLAIRTEVKDKSDQRSLASYSSAA